MKKRRRRRQIEYLLAVSVRVGILILLLILLWQMMRCSHSEEKATISDAAKELILEPEPQTVEEKLEHFSEKNGFSVDEYPEELIELMRRNEETEEFVLNYPLKKNTFSMEELTELENEEDMPLLIQWDSRWGYYQYGENVMGLTGCGPTCLSMVASYLLRNPQLTPLYMADYATQNGYCVNGSGTSWDFMSQGARSLGLQVWEVPLDENTVKQYLQGGHPIICIMGPGEFTDGGHFVVFKGWKNNKIVMNDPNSREHSERLWDFEEIKGQIRNMWAYLKN